MLIDTDAGVFHTKLRGAAQAPASLVAEIIVGALADALGLSVPARVLIDIPSDVPVDDPHQELGELLHRSVGRNLGFQYMSDVRSFHPIDAPRVDLELASKIVWLDGLVQNPDRTVKNPNLLWSQAALWLIDHGASLGFQHDWPRVTEQSPRSNRWQVGGHVLRSRATQLQEVDTAWPHDCIAVSWSQRWMPSPMIFCPRMAGKRRGAVVRRTSRSSGNGFKALARSCRR